MPNQYTSHPRHITVTCPPCGGTFEAKLSVILRGRGKFCSLDCKSVSMRGTSWPRPGSSVLFNNGVVAHVPLYDRFGDTSGHVIIDASDVEWVTRVRWSLNEGYAHHGADYLHRKILGLTAGDGLYGDHINRNRLDCRRENLRPIPKAGNAQNRPSHGGTSRFRGVSWNRQINGWTAHIMSNRKSINLGTYATEEEAAEVARVARAQLMPYAMD